jgi:hypothetical protein
MRLSSKFGIDPKDKSSNALVITKPISDEKPTSGGLLMNQLLTGVSKVPVS